MTTQANGADVGTTRAALLTLAKDLAAQATKYINSTTNATTERHDDMRTGVMLAQAAVSCFATATAPGPRVPRKRGAKTAPADDWSPK